MRRFTVVFSIAVLLAIAPVAAAQELEIHCLDIGHGDCTVVIAPGGKTMMIDASLPFNASEEQLCSYLDSLGISHLDYLIITHYHRDHLGGVDTLIEHGITIDTVYDRGWWYCTSDYSDKYVPAIDTIRHTLTDAQVIDLGGGSSATVLAVNGNGLLPPPFVDTKCTTLVTADENDYCVALLIKFGNFEFFVAGDLSGVDDDGYANIETSIIPEAGDVDVYRVNHHGSKFSTNQEFLEALSPEVSILSVGNNSYGHPDTAVLRRLQEQSEVYQTSDSDGNSIDGDVVIMTSGEASFTVNADIYPLPVSPYYHAFQNFDDDVDRVKTYSNFLGGDHGMMSGDPGNPMIAPSCDTAETRTGFGRSLQIDYGPLTDWSMYVESFERRWTDPTTCFNLADLFEDYENPLFQLRHIDSIVFYCKLIATDPLTLRLELKDSSDAGSSHTFDILPEDSWQRIAVALDQLSGSFDDSTAKFLGLMFDAQLDNHGEAGTLFVDDFYLIENEFAKPSFSDNLELLDYLNQVNFRHFWTAVEPVSKLALDRHIWTDLISVDAVGFQLASYVIAHKNGWLDPALLEGRVTHILSHLLYECEHAADSFAAVAEPLRYATVDGIWAHFLDNQSLARKDVNTEFSLFTNALLLSGVLVCQEYFDSNDSIVAMADSLYRMADWNFLYVADSNVMRYAWTPEEGYSAYWTDWFSEELDLAFLLAISTPQANHRIGANPFYSPYYLRPVCSGQLVTDYVYSASGSGFTYYFLQMYARFPQPASQSVFRFENARKALLADLAFCNAQYNTMDHYDSRIFGTTACEGPDSAGVDALGNNISNYHAYGYPCRADVVNEPNGTIAVYGSGAAILFIPDEAIACLRYYYDELDSIFADSYGFNFWSPIFGFPDAFHLEPDNCGDPSVTGLCFRGPWVSVPRFGIDVGPMLLNIDSYISENSGNPSVRDWFSQNDYLAPNIGQFDPISVGVDDKQINLSRGHRLYPCYPNPFNARTLIQFDLPSRGRARLEVLNVLGQRISVLVDGVLPSGSHRVFWDGTDERGQPVATGVYFYQIKVEDFVESKKMVLLK